MMKNVREKNDCLTKIDLFFSVAQDEVYMRKTFRVYIPKGILCAAHKITQLKVCVCVCGGACTNIRRVYYTRWSFLLHARALKNKKKKTDAPKLVRNWIRATTPPRRGAYHL